jgi:hypothetical protein
MDQEGIRTVCRPCLHHLMEWWPGRAMELQRELISKNHHIRARSLKNHRFSLKLQKSTGIEPIACNMH